MSFYRGNEISHVDGVAPDRKGLKSDRAFRNRNH